jgi:hypothetical protein
MPRPSSSPWIRLYPQPRLLDLPRPRREDHTTCTAVAPDVVFTVRTYGTRPLYEPRLVRKFSFNEPESHRSATRQTGHSQNVAQLRSSSRVVLHWWAASAGTETEQVAGLVGVMDDAEAKRIPPRLTSATRNRAAA